MKHKNTVSSWWDRRAEILKAAQSIAQIWQQDWTTDKVSATLGRYSAHLAILALALTIGIVSQINASPITVTGQSATDTTQAIEDTPSSAAREVAPAPVSPETMGYSSEAQNTISRAAQYITTIPERERLEVITYTVQEGDSIFSIAEAFKLSPYSVVWGNMEILQGAPWLLQPGLPLFILPVDGAYHTVSAGQSAGEIADDYDVTVETLYNTWNDIEPDQPLAEGTLLVIPDGVGPDFDWEPPPPPTPAYVAQPEVDAAAAQAPAVSPSASATANGWFILPTGSYAVSGWTFHDPRKPTHIGLDYRCRLNDPIYAADGGTVVFAGWGGGYGNLVRIDHGNGFITYYGHFNAFAVTSGQAVGQGQLIGYCGTTGYSTGPHLHYEIRLNGVPQNPAVYEP
jgi:murein DD-endopeptidase MepM/ murein hydrolase activator NlpD